MAKKTKKDDPAALLVDVVKNIKARLKKVDDYRVSAAILIHEARELVAEGAAGPDVKWSEWAPKQFSIGYREIKRLAAIGSAPHPETAMEEHREAEAARMKELRAKRKAPTPQVAAIPGMTPLGMAPEVEKEPEAFSEEDFVVEGDVRTPPQAPPVEDDEDVDGVERISENLDDEEADRLRIWNTAVRAFASLTHERRRLFVQWAVTMCVDAEEGKADPLEIPAFLQRGTAV